MIDKQLVVKEVSNLVSGWQLVWGIPYYQHPIPMNTCLFGFSNLTSVLFAKVFENQGVPALCSSAV